MELLRVHLDDLLDAPRAGRLEGGVDRVLLVVGAGHVHVGTWRDRDRAGLNKTMGTMGTSSHIVHRCRFKSEKQMSNKTCAKVEGEWSLSHPR